MQMRYNITIQSSSEWRRALSASLFHSTKNYFALTWYDMNIDLLFKM